MKKYFSLDSFLTFKTIIFLIFASLIAYNFRSILKSNKDLLILSILTILGSLFFISLFRINSQRFFLIPYFFIVLTLLTYWDFNPIKSIAMFLFIIFFGLIYFSLIKLTTNLLKPLILEQTFQAIMKQ